MALRRMLLLLCAMIMAGAMAMVTRTWLVAERGPAQVLVAAPTTEEALFEVLVAETTLAAGSFLKPDQTRWQRWPTDDVPDSYFLKGARSRDAVLGAVVRQRIAAGEPLTDGALVKPGDRGFLAAVLTPGRRAVSVPINATSGNAGLIFPGDRVDLILTHSLRDPQGDTTRRVSETVLEDVRIIAMGVELSDEPKVGDNHERARTATLEVTPREAEKVTLITELGKLSLSLRSLARGDGTASASITGAEPFTWDRDVSQVLRSGSRLTSRLVVLRGGAVETVRVQPAAPQ